ncbi:hypothetical protein Hanom_Chr10g00928311 [Helianthus anomalus]
MSLKWSLPMCRLNLNHDILSWMSLWWLNLCTISDRLPAVGFLPRHYACLLQIFQPKHRCCRPFM